MKKQISFIILFINKRTIVVGSSDNKPTDWWVMRFKKWSHINTDYKCHGKVSRFICNVGLGDLFYITRSKYLFLNKISLQNEPVTYQCLEYWIRNQADKEQEFDVSQYSKISSKRTFDEKKLN